MPVTAKSSGKYSSIKRLNNAGISLRLVRSPLPPNMTMTVGGNFFCAFISFVNCQYIHNSPFMGYAPLLPFYVLATVAIHYETFLLCRYAGTYARRRNHAGPGSGLLEAGCCNMHQNKRAPK